LDLLPARTCPLVPVPPPAPQGQHTGPRPAVHNLPCHFHRESGGGKHDCAHAALPSAERAVAAISEAVSPTSAAAARSISSCSGVAPRSSARHIAQK